MFHIWKVYTGSILNLKQFLEGKNGRFLGYKHFPIFCCICWVVHNGRRSLDAMILLHLIHWNTFWANFLFQMCFVFLSFFERISKKYKSSILKYFFKFSLLTAPLKLDSYMGFLIWVLLSFKLGQLIWCDRICSHFSLQQDFLLDDLRRQCSCLLQNLIKVSLSSFWNSFSSYLISCLCPLVEDVCVEFQQLKIQLLHILWFV